MGTKEDEKKKKDETEEENDETKAASMESLFQERMGAAMLAKLKGNPLGLLKNKLAKRTTRNKNTQNIKQHSMKQLTFLQFGL